MTEARRQLLLRYEEAQRTMSKATTAQERREAQVLLDRIDDEVIALVQSERADKEPDWTAVCGDY